MGTLMDCPVPAPHTTRFPAIPWPWFPPSTLPYTHTLSLHELSINDRGDQVLMLLVTKPHDILKIKIK